VELPPGASTIWLISRAAIPAESNQESSDRRRLGVALIDLMIDQTPVELHEAALKSGWHKAEPGFRWSDGKGEIRIPTHTRSRRLSLRTGRWQQYALTGS